MASEPINLKEWKRRDNPRFKGRLFTCGRPGRGIHGRKRISIKKDTIEKWVEGLPESDEIQLVSLLGKKHDGYSEYSYYPFKGSFEEGKQPTIS